MGTHGSRRFRGRYRKVNVCHLCGEVVPSYSLMAAHAATCKGNRSMKKRKKGDAS